MIDYPAMTLQIATDYVMTFMPMRGKSPERIAREIERVRAYLLWADAQSQTATDDDEDEDYDEDDIDPDTGLLREGFMVPFLKRWIREVETGIDEEGNYIPLTE